MKLIYKIHIDETVHYDSRWNEESFGQIIKSILKNPYGYDVIEDFNITLDGSVTRIKLKKKEREHEANIITRKEYHEDKIIYTIEIWPLEPPDEAFEGLK